MATQLCPNCQEDDFTWSMTEDETGQEVTEWRCGCGFHAIEYERYLAGEYQQEPITTNCLNCTTMSGIVLHREGERYLWCYHCNILTKQISS
jgi:hypothetical protein